MAIDKCSREREREIKKRKLLSFVSRDRVIHLLALDNYICLLENNKLGCINSSAEKSEIVSI